MIPYFIDFEFIRSGLAIYPISIGVVPEEEGEEPFYRIFEDCPFHLANDWVKRNVLPQLEPRLLEDGSPNPVWSTTSNIASDLMRYVGYHPQWWGWYSAYDYVVLCNLYGDQFEELPPTWPHLINDLKQVVNSLGNPRIPVREQHSHHAMWDAIWNRNTYRYLKDNYFVKWRPVGGENKDYGLWA